MGFMPSVESKLHGELLHLRVDAGPHIVRFVLTFSAPSFNGRTQYPHTAFLPASSVS